MDSHIKDKTVSPTVLSLTWEYPYLAKTVFKLRRDPVSRLSHIINTIAAAARSQGISRHDIDLFSPEYSSFNNEKVNTWYGV